MISADAPGGTYQHKAAFSHADEPRSAFGDASNALDEAQDLARRVSVVVDRLLGSTPQAVSTGNKLPAVGSILQNLRDEAERTVDAVRTAMSQLNRLERELP